MPIVFGEGANKQDEWDDQTQSTVYGYYDLDGAGVGVPAENGFNYQDLITLLNSLNVGWLAWSWGPDSCDARQMSSDKTFAGLTSYGQAIAKRISG